MRLERLETSDGQFICMAEPVVPLKPDKVLIWGERIFTRHCTGPICDIWRETYPSVVVEQ